MTARATKPITVTLGALGEQAQQWVASGRYASMSELVRAGLRALEREERTLDAILKQKVEEALADPRPPIPQEEVFAKLEALHRKYTAK
jgi:antitoxin ParD1/3/4